jgi:beta-lactamase class A
MFVRIFLAFCLFFWCCCPVFSADPSLYGLKHQILDLIPPESQGKIGLSLVNLNTGDTLGVNENEMVNPASVIKVAVMVEAYIQASQGRFKFSDKLILRQSHKVYGAGPLFGQPNGKAFPIQYLIECMIHFSDNTATKMLIDFMGKDSLNLSMRKLGLTQTVVGNSDLLKAKGLNFSTPRDTTLLLSKIAKGSIVSNKACREMVLILSQQKYRWGIPKPVTKDILVANKTGTLDGIKHDAGIVFVKQCPYAITIFSSDFKSAAVAMQLIAKISDVVFTWSVIHVEPNHV